MVECFIPGYFLLWVLYPISFIGVDVAPRGPARQANEPQGERAEARGHKTAEKRARPKADNSAQTTGGSTACGARNKGAQRAPFHCRLNDGSRQRTATAPARAHEGGSEATDRLEGGSEATDRQRGSEATERSNHLSIHPRHGGSDGKPSPPNAPRG